MAVKKRAYFVVSTHWDREWYETFQHFRFHLVELLDEVLDVMAADERFRCFQTDGQSIILEDYLEIRPEREEQVRKYCAEGRLRVGPWYTMPDENIVGPESLIRNLEEGIAVAREFGNVSKAGFVCDIFGHVSQIPQVFKGFGIDNALLWRGTNEDTHSGMFRWEGADGSEIVCFRFGPRDGYFDFGRQVRRAFEREETFELQRGVELMKEFIDQQCDRVEIDAILLFDGGDHMPIEPQSVALLDGCRQAYPEMEFIHAGLDDFMADAVAQRGKVSRVFSGELRTPGRLMSPDPCWVIPGVLSSRVRLKQSNRARENELLRWVEPFSHLANQLAGFAYPHSYIRRSWRYLLENHAHDSICGCSPDQVHKDMDFRFDQSRLINTKLIDQGLRAIATRVDLPDLEDDAFSVTLFNPTQSPIDGPVDFELWFDEHTKKKFAEFFGYEGKVGFHLRDADGAEIPYDYLRYNPQRRRFSRRHKHVPFGQECIVVDVCAPLKIPAFGYTTITCQPVAAITRHPFGQMVKGDRCIENERLKVTVNDNGSLRLADKQSGQVFDRLLVFEERADIGDGWYHGVAVNDQIHSSTASPVSVAVVENGAYRATLKITHRMMVPDRFLFELQMRRSDQTVPLAIESYVTLRPGSDHLEIRTEIDNQVRDHRLRVLFESNANTAVYLADSAFDVVGRDIALPDDNHTYKELQVETTPHASWTAVHDAKRGLAVVAPDLCETAVRDVPERTLALTLLRGFRRTIFTDGEEGGQELGDHVFNYCLVPLAGPPDRNHLAGIAQRIATPVRCVDTVPAFQAPKAERLLPRTEGMLTLESGKAVITSMRRRGPDERFELRCYNPHEQAVAETMILHRRVTGAALVDFEGNLRQQLSPDGRRVKIDLAPKQIATIALTLS